MREQKILWTVLPNGRGQSQMGQSCLKFSVFVSPRLWKDGAEEPTLKDFPDFLHNWPQRVRGMTFEVAFDGGPPVTATLDDSHLDMGLWQVLFNEDTYVRPHEFRDMKDRVIRTYPVHGVLSYLKKKYVAVGENSPSSRPLLEPRTDDDGKPIDDSEATLETFTGELGDTLEPQKEVIGESSGERYKGFLRGLMTGQIDEVFTYVKACLENVEYRLSDDAKISKMDDYTWKIIDGEEEYYLEDTGRELQVYHYLDIYDGIDKELEKTKVLDPARLYGYRKEKLDFLQASRFYDRREKDNPYCFKPNARVVPPSPEVPRIDFHQMLATLGDHPLLMRKLGLVLDFEIDVPQQPVSAIRLVVKTPAGHPLSGFNENLRPVTKCILDADRFIAASKPGSSLKDGMLDLTDADEDLDGSAALYSLVQFDPDGAALKAIDAAGTMTRQVKKKYLFRLPKPQAQRLIRNCDIKLDDFKAYAKEMAPEDYVLSRYGKIQKTADNKWMITDRYTAYEIEHTGGETLKIYKKMKAPYDSPDDAGLPSLRSAGIALIKSGRAFDLNKHFVAVLKKNDVLVKNDDNDLLEFHADDFIRGYRVDILDETEDNPEWRSLCERVGTYSFPGTGAEEIDVADEGYVKGASATSEDARDSDLYLHETMLRWDGWSLCARRPGKTMVPITSEQEVYLFTWDDVPADCEELIDFLETYLDARWARNAIIGKPDADTITVMGGENSLTITLTAADTATLTTDDGREYSYLVKEGNKIHTIIPRQTEEAQVVTNEPPEGFNLVCSFSAKPYSLPRLRFGHTYRLRVRAVDIAGNSVDLKSAGGSLASQSLRYARYEPLIPPAVVLRARISEGESVERMVIRSNFDKTVKAYIESDHVKKALEDEAYTYGEGNERHIVPPKTSQLMAETHGEFDSYIGENKNYQEGYTIALKAKGTLKDTGDVITPDVGEMPPEERPGAYIIHKESDLELPYLPDPIGRGAAFQNLPELKSNGTPGLEKIIDAGLGLNLLKVPFELKWPEAYPFRLRIQERPGRIEGDSCVESFDNPEDPPEWDPDKRLLTVFLAKAQIARVRYTCYMDEADLDETGIWKWLRDSSKKGQLRRYGISGSHWMLSPYREIVLVHAVQQPLCEPTIPLLNAIKERIGDTFANIKGRFHLSAKSTDKLDLQANWTEPDDLQEEGPRTIDVNSHAFELKIRESSKDTIAIPARPCVYHRHEFGDTKYRHVKYFLRGVTRFREYFHSAISTAKDEYCFDWDQVPGADSKEIIGFLLNGRRIAAAASAVIEKAPDGRSITVTENGVSLTIRVNKDQNALILITADGKEYIYALKKEAGKLCIDTNRITRRGPVYEVDVMNSARPAAPKVLYIIPTFGWEEKQSPEKTELWRTFQRKRIGGGLRVYLERPWYSSGDGELLGATLYPQLVPNKLKPYVSQWGMDPIRMTTVPKGVFSTYDFINSVASQKDLSLEEVADARVNVVAFKPEYNEDRKLWYCDIQIDPEAVISYYPFIRLALTRYQPNSIPDAHLSRVVLTDFVQLANDRTLRIDFRDDKKFNVSVSGHAPHPRTGNRVEVCIETLPRDGHEELGWVPVQATKKQPNPCTLKPSLLDKETLLSRWDGALSLPDSRKKKRFRLVVREYEWFLGDKERKEQDDVPTMLRALTTQISPTEEKERLVYVDVVDVSRSSRPT